MPFSLRGHTALVTGSGGPDGIGFATARMLAAMGAAVAVTSTTDRCHDRAVELADDGGDALGHAADLTDPTQAKALVDAVIARWGRLDVVVNNAGMTSVNDPDTGDSSSISTSSTGGTASSGTC